MSGSPSLVVVLKFLIDKSAWANLSDVITATGESQTRTEKALAKLAEEGIIECRGQCFRFVPNERAEIFTRKFLGLYQKISQGKSLELIVRGILSSVGYPSSYIRLARLLEVLGKEEFRKEEVTAFLESEADKNQIEKLFVLFTISRPGSASAMAYQPQIGNTKWLRIIPISRVPYPPPLAISTFFMSTSRDVKLEDVIRLKEEYFVSNPMGMEEEYVMGIYPSELTQPALKYLTSEKPEMLKMLKEEAHQPWFRLRYSW